MMIDYYRDNFKIHNHDSITIMNYRRVNGTIETIMELLIVDCFYRETESMENSVVQI